MHMLLLGTVIFVIAVYALIALGVAITLLLFQLLYLMATPPHRYIDTFISVVGALVASLLAGALWVLVLLAFLIAAVLPAKAPPQVRIQAG